MHRLAARLRTGAPEIAKLRAPETDPISRLFQKAQALETRLQEDAEEDMEASAFVTNGGLDRLRARD